MGCYSPYKRQVYHSSVKLIKYKSRQQINARFFTEDKLSAVSLLHILWFKFTSFWMLNSLDGALTFLNRVKSDFRLRPKCIVGACFISGVCPFRHPKLLESASGRLNEATEVEERSRKRCWLVCNLTWKTRPGDCVMPGRAGSFALWLPRLSRTRRSADKANWIRSITYSSSLRPPSSYYLNFPTSWVADRCAGNLICL